jgi:methylenetetrahydrofolate--tRNA-(uracil-5-)-methyltransferase
MNRLLSGEDPVVPPPTTMMGGLYRYLRDAAPGRFQPMNSNWGLVDPLPRRVKNKKEKRVVLAKRAQEDFLAWMSTSGFEVADDAPAYPPVPELAATDAEPAPAG